MSTLRGELPDYPWDAMGPFIERAAAHPGGMLDLSIGSPVDPTPRLAREALAAASDAHAYPATAGAQSVREAIAEWYVRRRGVTVAPDAVLPTIGSKEFVALLPFLLGIGPGEAVVHPRIAYPSYAMGAALVGADAIAADDPGAWPDHTRLVWLNSPSNPDGRVLGVADLRQAVERARELGAVIVGDECYAEFGWESPWDEVAIPSILDPRVVGVDHRGVLAAYSLSKQSNLAGYRAACVAGDAELIARLLTVRKHAGLMLPAPIQQAMVAVLGDASHVAQQRETYRKRRSRLRRALESAGYVIEGSDAGLYLWVAPRDNRGERAGADPWFAVAEFAELGIVVGPGHFYGPYSAGYVRLSVTANDGVIEQAAQRLEARRI